MVDMANRKVNSKAKPRSISLRHRRPKRRSSYFSYRSTQGFLDRSISVRGLLTYSGIVLGCIIVLACMFFLGRVSVEDNRETGTSANTQQLSGPTKQVVKDSASDSSEGSTENSEDNNSSGITQVSNVKVANLSETVSDIEKEEEDVEYVYDTEPEITPSCKNKVAVFDYNYTNVLISVSNFQRELKGENWATVSSLKLSITNNEKCTIINPTKIKIKMNPKGKGSVWWDDDLFLSSSFKNMLPGSTVTEIVPVHVSYSDIYSEKDFRLTVFDDYGIPMGTFKKYITLP